MSEFDLSSKSVTVKEGESLPGLCHILGGEDVKEFIRLRHKIDNLLYFNEISWDEHERLCKKLAGEDLIK